MRVFVVGASGVIGTRLVPQLVEHGHDVIGTAHSPERAQRVRAQGAEGVALDLLDGEAVAAARPDAIVHEATALSGLSDFKHFDRSFAQTNRLRTEGTDALLGAARKRRFPIVGDGDGISSFIHLEDAAAATVLALEQGGGPAIYNVVDDEPAPVREWLPALARALGAPPPRRFPSWRTGFAAAYGPAGDGQSEPGPGESA